DAVVLREGAARLLEEAGFDVVAQAGDAEDLLRKVRAHKPEVAIIDVRMPPGNIDDGLQAALTIRDELPDIGLLLFSQYVEDRYLGELLASGAEGVGYLLKDRVSDVDRLVEAVQRVAAGGSVLDSEVVAHIPGGPRRRARMRSTRGRDRPIAAPRRPRQRARNAGWGRRRTRRRPRRRGRCRRGRRLRGRPTPAGSTGCRRPRCRRP